MLDPARFKLARCTRRAGKSVGIAVTYILACGAEPNTPCLYLGLTRESAKEAIWPILIQLLEAFKIPHEALESGPRIKFPNGSYIQLLGADAVNARARIRGRKFKVVGVDEAAFFNNDAATLITDLLPTLADLKGSLVMASSPGKSPSGFFYEADVGKMAGQWARYSWSLLDNPLFQGPASDPQFANRGEEELHNICMMQFGGDRDHPDFRREYLGEWAISKDAFVYPVGPHNMEDYSKLLDNPEYAIGLKFTSDASYAAATVLKYSQYSRRAIFEETLVLPNPDIPGFAALVKGLVEKYNPQIIVGHEGKVGKLTTVEMSTRFGLHIQPSVIIDKAFYQRIFAGDLKMGDIQVNPHNSAVLLAEWAKIVKDDNGEEMTGIDNHASDAALGVYRRIYSAFLRSAQPKETEEQRMIRQVEESYHREKEDESDWL